MRSCLLIIVAISSLIGAGHSQSSQSNELNSQPPSIQEVMKGEADKWAKVAARKPEVQLKSVDVEKIKGLLVGRMSNRDWLINGDETAHQISFSKNLGDQAKSKLIRVQFALSPDTETRCTSVIFTLMGSKEEFSQTEAVRVKGEIFAVLDEITAKTP